MIIYSKNEAEPTLISEGATKLWIVKQKENKKLDYSGPGCAKTPVFFNPVMEFSRDVGILVVEHFINKKRKNGQDNFQVKLLDGLAGTGARGVRFGVEAKGVDESDVKLVINDHNPLAYKFILKNIESNNLKHAIGSNKDLNSLLAKDKFDYIDLDPFGSPIKFLDAGSRGLRNNGIIAVTATDTATLFGRYPKTCLRRYDAVPYRTGFGHELGLRILLGTCVRTAARYNLGLEPLLVHATNYYYKLYLRGTKSRSAADRSLGNLGYVIQPRSSNNFKVITQKEHLTHDGISALIKTGNVDTNDRPTAYNVGGPLWIGALYDGSFVESLNTLKDEHTFGTEKQLTKMLSLWQEEAASPFGFYEANKLASELKVSTPKLTNIMKVLTDQGYQTTHTHFGPNAFKTNAAFDEVCNTMKNLSSFIK